MSHPTSLLLQLEPLVPIGQVTEQSVYNIVNQIAPVRRIWIMTRESPIKIIVQVDNQTFADMLKENLSGRTTRLGKLTIGESSHQNVDCSQRIEGINGSSNIEILYPYIKQYVKIDSSQNTYDYLNDNRYAQFLSHGVNKITDHAITDGNSRRNTHQSNTGSNLALNKCPIDIPTKLRPEPQFVISHIVYVTHDNPLQLTHNKVLRELRKFGRIKNMVFNDQRAFWSLEYESEKHLRKVTKVLLKNKLNGYKLLEDSDQPMIYPYDSYRRHNLLEPSRKVDNLHLALHSDEDHDVKVFKPIYLRLALNGLNLSLADIASLVSKLHLPVNLICGFDPKMNTICYLVEFRYVYQLLETLVAIDFKDDKIKCSIAYL